MLRARPKTTRPLGQPPAPPAPAGVGPGDSAHDRGELPLFLDPADEGGAGSSSPAPTDGADFTLDDSVLTPRGGLPADRHPLDDGAVQDAPQPRRTPIGRRPRRFRLPSAGGRVSAPAGPVDHAPESLPTQGLVLSAALFGAALLLFGLLFFWLKRENLGLDPLAQWRPAPSTSAPSTPAPSTLVPSTLVPSTPVPSTATRMERDRDRPVQTPAANTARAVAPAAPRAVGRRVAARPPAKAGKPAKSAPAAKSAAAVVPAAAPARDRAAGAGADDEVHFTLAAEYQQVGDSRGAEQVYRRLFRESPQKARAAFALGELLMEQGRFPEARDMYTLSKELQDAADQTGFSRK